MDISSIMRYNMPTISTSNTAEQKDNPDLTEEGCQGDLLLKLKLGIHIEKP